MGANLRLGAYSNKYGNFHWLSLARLHHLPGPVFDKKRGNKGSFCSPSAFNSDIDKYTWLKWCYPSQSLQAKLSFEAKIVPLLSFCNETRLVTPLFCLCFSLIMATQKINLKGKKTWIAEVACINFKI